MPKIPTYTSKGSMTTATPSVESNIKLNVNQTPASALQPVSNFIRDSYIQEKTTEANNKSYQLLNDFYEDQKDEQGKVVQKGWLTISSEAKGKSNPTQASDYYESEVNKLYNYHKVNKHKGLNNFEKKAIDRKFYATSGLLKSKVLEKARLNLIKENQEVDDDYFVKESLLLKELGPMYIEQFKKNQINRINSNPDYDDGVKKQLIKTYSSKGVEFLATSMANNNPLQFKEARKQGAFDDVDAATILKLESVASEQIKKQKFNTLLSGLDVPFDADPRDFVIANEEIKNKTFGGNENLQNLFKSLSPQEVIEFDKEYQTKAKAIKSDRSIQILTANQVGKFEAAKNTNEVFNNLAKDQGTYTDTLKRLFPNNQPAVEQLISFNQKVGDGTVNNFSKFDQNDDIIKFIINDEINTVYDPFTLLGETNPKSIMERAGESLNVSDIKFLNSLLLKSNEEGFKENHTKFFNFIDLFSLEVAGSSALKSFDPNRDTRLNNFKYTMYIRYMNGLNKGLNPDEMLTAARGNKNFIGYDVSTFLPKMNDVFQDIRNNFNVNTNTVTDLKTLRLQKEKELGRKLTIEEILELKKGL
tara:strand:+ start:433 stop:2193 length:1761 start_codon:yes stop_codon:yes gene_type:complete